MLDAVSIDRVGVAATDLHELEMVVTGQGVDARDERPRCGRVSVLVDEAHRLDARAPPAPERQPDHRTHRQPPIALVVGVIRDCLTAAASSV